MIGIRAPPPRRRTSHVGDRLHVDVPARQLPAHLRQHDLPRDLRADRRGRHGTPALPRLLPARRARRARRAGRRRPQRQPAPRSAPPAPSPPCSAATSCCIPARACSRSCSSCSSSRSSRCRPRSLLGFWFLSSSTSALAGLASPWPSGEGVAYFAHIGGFALRPARDQAVRRRAHAPNSRAAVAAGVLAA